MDYVDDLSDEKLQIKNVNNLLLLLPFVCNVFIYSFISYRVMLLFEY